MLLDTFLLPVLSRSFLLSQQNSGLYFRATSLLSKLILSSTPGAVPNWIVPQQSPTITTMYMHFFDIAPFLIPRDGFNALDYSYSPWVVVFVVDFFFFRLSALGIWPC